MDQQEQEKTNMAKDLAQLTEQCEQYLLQIDELNKDKQELTLKLSFTIEEMKE